MIKHFNIGGISSCVATLFIQPIDMVKVRIQILSGENPGVKYGPLKVSRLIKAEGGFPTFYRGLDAALMRHFIYSSTKFGVFLNLTDYLRKHNSG